MAKLHFSLVAPERELFSGEVDMVLDALSDTLQADGASLETLWTYMRQRSRPSFNPSLLAEFTQWQNDIAAARSSAWPWQEPRGIARLVLPAVVTRQARSADLPMA